MAGIGADQAADRTAAGVMAPAHFCGDVRSRHDFLGLGRHSLEAVRTAMKRGHNALESGVGWYQLKRPVRR
jgi:hypothetical protein